MKTWKLNSNELLDIALSIALVYIALGGGNDPVYANLTTKMNTIKSNFLSIGQASSGIGIIIGLILMEVGASQIGGMIAKGSAVGLVILYMFEPIVGFLKGMSGA